MIPAPTIVWFRQDLRLADNPALAQAVASGAPIVALYVFDDDTADHWRPGGASRWWLHHSLTGLDATLRNLGSRLVLRRGAAAEAVEALVDEIGADTVLWNRCYEPAIHERDTRIKAQLRQQGVAARSYNANLLFEPWTIASKSGKPYRVFRPFWRACLAHPEPPTPLAGPARVEPFPRAIASDDLSDWGLLPTGPDWSGGLRATWAPGEASAKKRLVRFVQTALEDYRADRDRPDIDGTSCLSPHLSFGEISPRQIWHAVRDRMEAGSAELMDASVCSFLRQIGWREFSYHLLHHFPTLPDQPLDQRFAHFPWAGRNAGSLKAWQRGRTGYPIVDAGMRQLWATGWMHNRLRMIVASFLIKDLLIPWQTGEAWFWDTLVDADLANNAASWQWVAGSGADAAPYFRVFNPVLQGEKFDAEGTFVRHWVPELAGLPNKFIHNPWEAPPSVLSDAGIVLGKTYPRPIVDHGQARRTALGAYDTIKATA